VDPLSPTVADIVRNDQQSRLYRLRPRITESEPLGAVDACSSKVASVHHPGEVHRPLRAPDDTEVRLKQVSRAGDSRAATVRGNEQATSTAATAGHCRTTSSSASCAERRVCEHADEPVRCTACPSSTEHVQQQQQQQHVPSEPPRRTTAVSRTSCGPVRPTNAHDAATTASAVQPAPESLRTGNYPCWTTAGLDNGPATGTYGHSAGAAARNQSP
jgi:hypothetical protein